METFAAVVQITDAVVKLSSAIAKFRHDYKLADKDLDAARTHALLLKEEIAGLESRMSWKANMALGQSNEKKAFDQVANSNHDLVTDQSCFGKALFTASALLSDINTAFPLQLEPSTWRTKARWAIKDKRIFAELKERLRSTESTLQGIVSMEQL
jgi:hypothetical protein